MEDISLHVDRKKEAEQEEKLASTITMSVTSIVGKGEDRRAYVLFQDKEKMAEFAVPGGKMMMNSGFSDEEIEKIVNYLKTENDYIMSIAKNVSPMKAFMGMKQG